MSGKSGNTYSPQINRIRASLLNDEGMSSLIEEFDEKDLGRSLAFLTTFESTSAIQKILGKPASDLRILCDVNFSYALTHMIYENIGIPHFTFSKRTKDEFSLVTNCKGSIKQNSSDKALYEYAQSNDYDAILSCDKNLSGSNDLCYIANHHFSDKADQPAIVIIPVGVHKGLDFIKVNGSEIIDTVDKHENAVIDLT